MIRLASLFVLLLSISIFSQSQTQNPSLLLSSDSKEIRINTADDYSLKTRTGVYSCQYVRASEIAEVIRKSLSVYGKISVNDITNTLIITDEISKLENVLAVCKDLDRIELKGYVHLLNEKIPMKYNKASEIANIVKNYLSIEGSLTADDNFNVLFVNDHPSHIEKIRKKVEEYDVAQKQIVIDLEIVEIERNNLMDYGIDWDNVLSSGWAAFSGGYTKISDLPKSIVSKFSDNPKSIGIGAGVNVSEVREVVRFMQQKGFAKILSTPKIITTSGKNAHLWYGQDIQYAVKSYNRSTSSGIKHDLSSDISNSFTDNDNDGVVDYVSGSHRGDVNFGASTSGNGSQTERFEEERTAGLSLSITPFAGESDVIKMSVDCELTNIIGWSPQETPIISGQEIKNDIMGYKDKTILIGGLKSVKEINQKKRVPIIGYILPFLFSRDRKSKTETDIAIFITPRIFDVETMAEAADSNKKTMQNQSTENSEKEDSITK